MMASTNSYISLGNVIVAKPSWPSLFVTRAVDKRHSVTKEYLTVESQQCVWRSFFQSNVERMFL